jgi:predicted DNA-binding antitoxin AbrB/MazE fold protein
MSRPIKAVYEKGVLRLLEEVDLTEHEEVEVIVLQEPDDLPVSEMLKLAQAGKSFAFLEDAREDIYSLADGEPV